MTKHAKAAKEDQELFGPRKLTVINNSTSPGAVSGWGNLTAHRDLVLEFEKCGLLLHRGRALFSRALWGSYV